MLLPVSLALLSTLLAPTAPQENGEAGAPTAEPGDPLGPFALPQGSTGARPLDQIALGWPFYVLGIVADLDDPDDSKLVDGILDDLDALDHRVWVLIIDAGERTSEELEWLTWERGWAGSEVAFAAEPCEALDRPGTGWRLVVPEMVEEERVRIRDWNLEGFAGDEPLRALLGAVEAAIEIHDAALAEEVGSGLARRVASLELAAVAGALDEPMVRAGDRGATKAKVLESLTAVLTAARAARAGIAFRRRVVALVERGRLGDAEGLFRLGRNVCGFSASEWRRLPEVEALLGEGRAPWRAGEELDRVLRRAHASEAGLADVADDLREFLTRFDGPEPVVERARRLVALIDRFA